jgi:mannonate dehydratase
MKLGFNLGRDKLTPENLAFARQLGVTHLVVPDHGPELACDAPWHAGMAHAIGYLRWVVELSRQGSV